MQAPVLVKCWMYGGGLTYIMVSIANSVQKQKSRNPKATTMLTTSKISYFQVITTCLPKVQITLHFKYRPSVSDN